MKVKYLWEPDDIQQGVIFELVYGQDKTPVHFMIIRDRSKIDCYHLLEIDRGAFHSISGDHKSTKESIAKFLTDINCEPISQLLLYTPGENNNED